jgi:branched-chain amino acid transport system permease protein
MADTPIEPPAAAAPSAGAEAKFREFISKWGLWALLAALPVVYGLKDLSEGEGLSRLGQNILEGLSNGSIWALIALGYTLVYGIIELINFAHGDVFMIGSFVAAGIFGTIGLTLTTGPLGLIGGLLVVLIICMVACGSLNVMIERVG